MVGAWRSGCRSIGVDVLYKFGGKLVGERTRRPLQTTVTELLFADAAVVVASEREGMERAAYVLDEVTTEWDLTMSLIKTKLLVVSEAGSEEVQQPIIIHGQPIEVVDAFKYLGAVMEGKGKVLLDVEDKIARASRAFGALCRPVFNDGNLSRGTKRMVYRPAVLGVLKRMVYRLQCWGYSSMERRRGRGWCTGCSVGGTPLWSGDVKEDGVQAAVSGVLKRMVYRAAVLRVLLYGAETWKRMVYRLQC